MSTEEPTFLLVLVFDSPLKSREAFLAFQRLQLDKVVSLHDPVFIDKDEQGAARVQENLDPQPVQAAASSGLWGALLGTLVAGPIDTLVGAATSAGIGAIAAKLVDLGIPDA